MATEKDLSFVQFIFDNTVSGKLQWEPTATNDQFVVSIKGKYKVLVDRTIDEDDPDVHYYWLGLQDESDRELLKIWGTESPLVPKIFFLARRNSMNVDAALDEIMEGDLDEAKGPDTRISDDDIPF